MTTTSTSSGLRRVGITAFAVTMVVVAGSTPAAAVHDSVTDDCEIDESLEPLFDLLDALIELLFVAGVGIGTIGFMIGGVYLMMPGQDATRRGKEVWKYTFMGALLLLSSEMVVSFLVGRLGGTMCV